MENQPQKSEFRNNLTMLTIVGLGLPTGETTGDFLTISMGSAGDTDLATDVGT